MSSPGRSRWSWLRRGADVGAVPAAGHRALGMVPTHAWGPDTHDLFAHVPSARPRTGASTASRCCRLIGCHQCALCERLDQGLHAGSGSDSIRFLPVTGRGGGFPGMACTSPYRCPTCCGRLNANVRALALYRPASVADPNPHPLAAFPSQQGGQPSEGPSVPPPSPLGVMAAFSLQGASCVQQVGMQVLGACA